jgi:formate hydrogenlyase transcriptional activator
MNEAMDETKYLKTCINNLISMLTLPAIWTGREAHRIAAALLDVLLDMLQLDWVYVRLKDTAGSAPMEMIQHAQCGNTADHIVIIKGVLENLLKAETLTWPVVVQKPIKEERFSIAVFRLGLNDEMGLLVAASKRTEFPDVYERLLLNAAANQATIALQESRLLDEQRRLAEELDQEVARSAFYLAEGERLSHIGSWSFKPSGFFEHWSRELFEIYGLDPAGKAPTLAEYLALIHRDDRQFMAQLIEQMVAEHVGCDVKKRIVRPDGEVRHIRCVGIPVVDGEILKEIVGTAMDVTEQEYLTQELHRREAYLTEAQKLSHTGSFGWNPLSGEICWSDETFRIFQLDPSTNPTLDLVLRYVHPEDVAAVQKVIKHATRDGQEFDFEHRLLMPDGNIKHVRVVARPVMNESDNPEFVGAVTDVTERRAASVALERAFDEIRALKDQLYKENLALKEEIDRSSMFEEIVGASPALQKVLSRVSKVAGTDSTVLVTGETGTGKELIARAVHKRSARAERTFVSVNCAAIPQSLLASELFGHEKGAFTGALQRRLGRFELAEGGTIFLDEIGELPNETQIALLRVLQEREFERVGGCQPIRADVRVIAATNRNLEAAMAVGTFRKDLFYRLNVFPIAVPPLRERKEDIPLLVEYFVDRYSSKAGKKIRSISRTTLDRLTTYSWPGNIRELQNVIERSVILCDGNNFSIDDSWLSAEIDLAPNEMKPLTQKLIWQEKAIIEATLAECKGRISGPSGAAAKLGIPPSTLESKIRSLKIDKRQFAA